MSNAEKAVVIIKAGCGHHDHYELDLGEQMLFTSGGVNLPLNSMGVPRQGQPYTHFSLCQSCTHALESNQSPMEEVPPQ